MKGFIKSLDRFSVPVNFKVNKEDDTYKSVLGGIMTIILSMASLSYGAYVFWKWDQGKMSPKITETKQITDINTIQMNDLLQISFWKSNRTPIDPFLAKGNILTPYFFHQNDDGSVEIEQILSNNDTYISSYGGKIINPVLKQHLHEDGFGNLAWNIDLTILLAKCNPNDMKEGQYCASEEEIEEFYKQRGNIINVDFIFRKLNPLTQKIETSYLEYYIQVEPTLCATMDFVLYSTMYKVKDNLLFDTIKSQELMDKVTQHGYTNSAEYCENMFEKEALVQLYLGMEFEQTLQFQEFPNLGDLLANIGSIAYIYQLVIRLANVGKERDIQKSIDSLYDGNRIYVHIVDFAQVKELNNLMNIII